MNVQSIWVGEEYAFFPFRPNQTFVMNAEKGKALRIAKEKGYGRERAKTYVIFDCDGTERKIRARDVIDFWDSYERERNALAKEREDAEREAAERREKLRLEREERYRLEREAREARERQQADQTKALVDALVAKSGLPTEAILSVGTTTIALNRTTVEFWLSIKNGEKGG